MSEQVAGLKFSPICSELILHFPTPMLWLQGSKTYSTERLFIKGYKYVAIGGYVPDHNVLYKLKFDFLVIVEKDDATLLNDLLNTHFQSKLSRDMTKTESVDGGMPVFGQSFEDAGGVKDDYRAIRLKMKGKLDKYGAYVPKARITDTAGELVLDLNTLQGRQAVFFANCISSKPPLPIRLPTIGQSTFSP
jgi:hypothetical protein